MKKSYVPTTLGQFLNEQKAVTLTRKYGEKEPVVVGSRAPLRNTVLSYVAENEKVSRIKLKKFIAGLNEGSKNPNAAANMWLKRNSQFFVTEEKGGIVTYKLSKLGEKLLERMIALAESKINEEKTKKPSDADFKDPKTGKKGIHDKDVDECGTMESEEAEEVSESKKERIQKIVEQIRAKRASRLYEEDEEDEKEELEGPEEDVEDAEEDVEVPEEDVEVPEEDVEDAEEDVEDDDKVEVTEFIISVDDVAAALDELRELGIEAEEVSGEMGDEDMDMDIEGPEGEEEVDDFDLDLGGDIEGEEEDLEGDVEESVTGMEKFSKSRNAKYGDSPANLTEEEDDEMDEMHVTGVSDDTKKEFKKSDPGLLEDEDELGMDDLDVDVEDDVTSDDEELDIDVGFDEESDDTEEEMEMEGEKQIKVSAENWPQLKKWLEEKGVDIEEMFGGEIEMEGEDVEDEISFDGLEDTGEEKGGEEKEEEDDEEKEEGEEEEEMEEGYKK